MAYKINWFPNADEDFRETTQFLLDPYLFEEAEKFTETLFVKVKLF